MTIGIYKITNTTNNNFYIGSSKNIEKRFKRHITSLSNNNHHNIYLQRSWNKYGKNNFKFEIIEKTNIDNLLTQEQHYINLLNPKYNLGTVGGGDNISKHPKNKQFRELQSKIVKERLSKLTEEEKRIRSEKVKGDKNPNWKGGVKAVCVDCGEKISRYKTRCMLCCKLGKQNPFYGKSHSKETKNKISKVNKGKKPSNCKKIEIDGVIYESCSSAAKALGISPGLITYRVKKQYKGYKIIK